MVLTAVRTAPANHRDMTFVPDSFDALYRHYSFYVQRIVGRLGIPHKFVEDVSQDILAKFWQKNMLEQYDATYVASNGRPIIFGSFLGAFVVAWVPKNRDRIWKVLNTEFDFIDDDSIEQDRWLDSHGYTVEDSVEELEEEMFSNYIRSRLSQVAPVNSQDRCDLAALFDTIRSLALRGDKVTVLGLMEQFGVASPTMQKWLKRLRVEVETILREA